jgi:predicted transporter
VFALNLTWLSAIGVLIGVLVFALKISLGCGLASLSRRELISIAAGYLVLSLFMGTAIGMMPDNALYSALNTGVAVHTVVALLLIGLGITTAKRWREHHHDISRKTFWILSLPCPACLAASFISCSFLAGLLGVASWKIGVLVGLLFFAGIMAFSSALGRIKKTPSALGNAMIFLGLFYLLSLLLIPAYLSSEKLSFTPIAVPFSDLATSYLLIMAMAVLGFVSGKRGLYL